MGRQRMTNQPGQRGRASSAQQRSRMRRQNDSSGPPFVRIYPGSSEPPGDHPSRERGTTIVVSFLTLSILAGAGFVAVYWNGANTQLLGGCLAVMFLALGSGLVFWAHKLMLHREVTGRREPLESPAQERAAVFEDFYPGEPQIQRRKLVTWMSAAVIGTLAAAVISSLRSFYGRSPLATQLTRPVWRRGQQLVSDTGEKV